MRLGDYLRGISRTIYSPLAAAEVERRINDAAISTWRPDLEGVVGKARSGDLRLHYRHRHLNYTAKPVLVGRITPYRKGSQLELKYRPTYWTYAGFAAWYLWLLVILVIMVAASDRAALGPVEILVLMTFFGLGAAVPFIIHYFGTSRCMIEFDTMMDFVRRHAQADAREGRGRGDLL